MEPSPGAQALSGPKQRTMRLLMEAARELLRTGAAHSAGRGRARRCLASDGLPLLSEQRVRRAARDDVPGRRPTYRRRLAPCPRPRPPHCSGPMPLFGRPTLPS